MRFAANAVSLVLNGTLFAILGCCYFTSDLLTLPPPIIGQFSLTEEPDELEFIPVLLTGGSDDSSSVPTDISVTTDSTSAILSTSDNGRFAMPAGFGGRGPGSGNGSGTGSGIFAGGQEAQSYAYVVDASGSMQGGRMRLVLNELARSVSRLEDHQQFFVVFFSDRTFPMMWPKVERRLVTANNINRMRILQWAFTVNPDGGTDPRGALTQALELEPDVCYLLTDGQIPESTLRVVKRSRKRNTVVHTISVGNQAERKIMEAIAQLSGGEFTDVR